MNASQLLSRLKKAESLMKRGNVEEFVLELGIAEEEFCLVQGFQRSSDTFSRAVELYAILVDHAFGDTIAYSYIRTLGLTFNPKH